MVTTEEQLARAYEALDDLVGDLEGHFEDTGERVVRRWVFDRAKEALANRTQPPQPESCRYCGKVECLPSCPLRTQPQAAEKWRMRRIAANEHPALWHREVRQENGKYITGCGLRYGIAGSSLKVSVPAGACARCLRVTLPQPPIAAPTDAERKDAGSMRRKPAIIVEMWRWYREADIGFSQAWGAMKLIKHMERWLAAMQQEGER